jgi:hypothetical protein
MMYEYNGEIQFYVGTRKVRRVLKIYSTGNPHRLQPKSLITIFGSPKSGKTLLGKIVAPYLWASLFPGPHRFLYIDCSFLEKATTQSEKLWLLYTEVRCKLGIPVNPERNETNIDVFDINDLFKKITEQTIVTLDGYHHLLANLSTEDKVHVGISLLHNITIFGHPANSFLRVLRKLQ